MEDHRVTAALSYVYFVSLFIYLSASEDEFVRFHSKQGLTIFIVAAFVWLVGWIHFFRTITNIIQLVLLLLVIFGAFQALAGRRRDLPFISRLANRFFA